MTDSADGKGHLNALTQAEIGMIAQEGVQAFLTQMSGGAQMAICSNAECRVRLYVVPAGLGTRVPLCPACYGAAEMGSAEGTGTLRAEED